MVAKDEGDTEEEQQEGDQEDQGELLLQVGQPAGLATIFNFIQPVGRASSLSCSGHRGYKLCSIYDRSKTKWGSSHGLDEIVVQRDNSCGFFAVPVKIKWTNDRFGLIIWFLGEFACIWWRSMWWFVHLFFTQYGDFRGDLPELVIIKVMVWSPYLVKIHVTILSLFISPHRVIFLGICQNWWQLRW